jgi:cytosine/uracil/thiamine/allantoin permease
MFNRRTTGGKYWFTSGWNFKAVIAWALGSTAGIFGISSVDYVGPIAQSVGDVDISIPTAAIVGLLIYALLESAPKK